MKLLDAIEERLRAALGLLARPGAQAQLERELGRVQQEHGLNPAEVVRRLDQEPWLLRRLAGAITVEESFFFRHAEHFEALIAHVRGELADAASGPLSIWSAGCAGGEEPYSIAIAIHRALGKPALDRVRIFATDINEQALHKARRGVYGPWSFRGVPSSVLTAYFKAGQSNERRLIDPIREAVQFRHLSLEEHLNELQSESLDAVFFRNVAIYLTEESLTRVHAGMTRVLKQSAPLILSPTDPMPGSRGLARIRTEPGLILRRGAAAQPDAELPPARVRPALASPGLARALPSGPRVSAAAQLFAQVPQTSDAGVLSEAQALADRGELDQALARLDRELECREVSAALLGLRGRIHLSAGRSATGVRDLRAALFVDPLHVVLRFHYALGLAALKRSDACRAQLHEILRALDARPETDTLEDGESSVASVRRAARELLRRVE